MPLADAKWTGADEEGQRNELSVRDQDSDIPRVVKCVPGEPELSEEGLMLPFWRPNWLY
jgi:hypothetical protein